MKTKFIILFYDSNNSILISVTYEAFTFEDCHSWVNQEIVHNPKYAKEMLVAVGSHIFPDSTGAGNLKWDDEQQVMLSNSTKVFLTPREMDAVMEMRDGKSNEEGARNLGMSVSTLGTHTTSINQKVGGKNLMHSIAMLQNPFFKK